MRHQPSTGASERTTHMSSNNKVAWTRTTKTVIFRMDALNGIRTSSVTEVVEIMEIAEALGLDVSEIRNEDEVKLFNRKARKYMDSRWFGRTN